MITHDRAPMTSSGSGGFVGAVHSTGTQVFMLPDWIRQAFAVDGVDPPPTEEERRLVEQLAREVVRRHMTTPALVILESSRPLNFLGSQAMHVLAPLMSAVFDAKRYRLLSMFLERRDAIDLLCQRIEELERIAERRDAAPPGEP